MKQDSPLASGVLQEHSHHALNRAEDSPVDDDGAFKAVGQLSNSVAASTVGSVIVTCVVVLALRRRGIIAILLSLLKRAAMTR